MTIEEISALPVNNIADIKLRTKRKIGTILPDQISHGGDRKSKFPKGTLKLKDIGFTKKQSAEYQAIASLPEKDFEKHIREMKESNKELTTVEVIQLARKLNQPKEEKTGKLPEGKYKIIYTDPHKIN